MSEPEDDVEALADRMMEAPPEVRIDFLLRALGNATDKLDVVTRICKGRNDQLDRAHELITELQTERDRLRAVVEHERHINAASGCPDCGVHAGCYDVVAERDRLRAVVEAVSVMWDNVVHANPEGTLMGFPLSDYDTLERVLDALDVSGDMGMDRLREILANTATDVRVLAKANAHGNHLAATALIEQIEQRLIPFDVGEAAPCAECGHEYDCHTSGVAVGCDAMDEGSEDVCPCTVYRVKKQ